LLLLESEDDSFFLSFFLSNSIEPQAVADSRSDPCLNYSSPGSELNPASHLANSHLCIKQ
jgi:hypothetical protein